MHSVAPIPRRAPRRALRPRTGARRRLSLGALVSSLLVAPLLGGGRSPAGDSIDEEVRSLLQRECADCHGEERQRGRLRLDSLAAALRGGHAGPSVVAGDVEASELWRRVSTDEAEQRMPAGDDPLTPDELALLRRWIEAGAPGADDGDATGGAVTHWAYRKPLRPEPPATARADWCRQPLDAFVLAELEARGLEPAEEASRRRLLRRLFLDLIGLPPTPAEIDEYLRDTRPDADRRLVERLLASPHFGERWARSWLDVARYADTDGFNIDGGRSIWKYRDWVIDAFNRDLPFDEFTVAQIAGDLLPEADEQDRIATGFHRNTRRNTEGGVDAEEARWESLLDRVDTTATVWLGTTMNCAQCHNHKFDPFSQRDYYGLLAFFETSDEPNLDVSRPEDRERRARLDRELAALKKAQPRDEAAIKAKERERNAVPRVTTMVLREREGAVAETHLRVRGRFTEKGERIAAATPSVLHPFPEDAPRNRLGLARWLVHEDNPLVARVTVNRLWAELFGQPLVRTPEDFGTQSPEAEHRALLDWLATEFVREGWSTKALLRTIVDSATYRQDSIVTPQKREADPDNRFFSRGARFRLNAERLRDVTLTASGLLSRSVGGPSVYPVQADTQGVIPINKTSTRWTPSPGADRYRRGLYTFWRRTFLFTPFATFDAPTREFCSVRRPRTNTPLQALVALNDPGFFEAAQALARRACAEGGEDFDARLEHAFLCCLSREPRDAERAILHEAFEADREAFGADLERADAAVGEAGRRWLGELAAAGGGPSPPPTDLPELAAWTLLANVLLNLDESLSRQ